MADGSWAVVAQTSNVCLPLTLTSSAVSLSLITPAIRATSGIIHLRIPNPCRCHGKRRPTITSCGHHTRSSQLKARKPNPGTSSTSPVRSLPFVLQPCFFPHVHVCILDSTSHPTAHRLEQCQFPCHAVRSSVFAGLELRLRSLRRSSTIQHGSAVPRPACQFPFRSLRLAGDAKSTSLPRRCWSDPALAVFFRRSVVRSSISTLGVLAASEGNSIGRDIQIRTLAFTRTSHDHASCCCWAEQMIMTKTGRNTNSRCETHDLPLHPCIKAHFATSLSNKPPASSRLPPKHPKTPCAILKPTVSS